MELTRRWIGVLIVFSLVLSFPQAVLPAQAQQGAGDSKYFPESGHNLEEDFFRYYYSVENPTLVFGYPITEAFTDSNGLRVQYFQRARFEFHPEKPPDQRVQATPVGSLTYKKQIQLVINNPLACRYFSNTGFSVCYAFLQFFEENGGVEQFGSPISPFEIQDNLIVQYFEKARLEWRPWLGENQRVGIADLGRVYFEQLGNDPSLLRPAEPTDGGIKRVLALQVHAFVQKARTYTSDTQTVYILVQDQNLQQVNNARCDVTVRLPDGRSERGTFYSSNGICTLSFQFTGQPNGKLVYVDATVSYGDKEGKTTTSFRIWE